MNTERLFDVRVASRLCALHVFQVNNVIATAEGDAIQWAQQMCREIGIEVGHFSFSVINNQVIQDTEQTCQEHQDPKHQLNLL